MNEESKQRVRRKPITAAEVREAFASQVEKYPPILNLAQAAELSGYTPGTLKKKLSEGSFENSVSRGKPLLFWRDRLVLEVMNRPWSSPQKNLPKDIVQTDGGGHEAA